MRHREAHPALKIIVTLARKRLHAVAVVLFGSRARGDATSRSDFDCAIVAPQTSHQLWSTFCQEVDEIAPTLCGIDLIQWVGELPQHLKDRIQLEGVALYGSLNDLH